MWQSSLLGWWGGGRLGIKKRWPSGARVLRTPGSDSFRGAEYELDLPASAGDGPERLPSFNLSRSLGKVAGRHVGLDPPAGFDQQSSQNAYGGMKHLVFDDTGALLRKHCVQKPPACSQTSGVCGIHSTPLAVTSVHTSSLRTSAELAVCWPRQWLSHLLSTRVHHSLLICEAGLPTRGVWLEQLMSLGTVYSFESRLNGKSVL